MIGRGTVYKTFKLGYLSILASRNLLAVEEVGLGEVVAAVRPTHSEADA